MHQLTVAKPISKLFLLIKGFIFSFTIENSGTRGNIVELSSKLLIDSNSLWAAEPIDFNLYLWTLGSSNKSPLQVLIHCVKSFKEVIIFVRGVKLSCSSFEQYL